MDSEEITVLHVDPDEATRADVERRVGESADTTVVGTDTIERVREVGGSENVDCVISECELPDGTAFELFETVRETSPDTACILYTDVGFDGIDTTETGDAVVEYLSKRIPGTEQRLPGLVRDVVAERRQVGYPVPDHEKYRLAAIDDYDVTETEDFFGELAATAAFDRLTALVRSYFDADVAFLGILREHEEEFVACTGADWSMLDRENSICTYALFEDDVTVIEDIHEDRRFEHNEVLRDLGIRSYVSANLTTPDGQVVGELCATDDDPRSYDEQERRDIKRFADQVIEQFELRRKLPPSDATLNLGERL